jgi:DNA-binding Xre family transcriptional regulator
MLYLVAVTSGGAEMISYKRLWKLLIDKDMTKKDLRLATGMSTSSMAKMAHSQNINSDIIERCCKVLDCKVEEIMEYIPDEDADGE